MVSTVLAHLARLNPQKENAATDALAFILDRSPAARKALAELLRAPGQAPPAIGRVTAQLTVGDDCRPDVGLFGEDGQLVGFIEAKFWAALTEAQPTEYLRRLDENGGGSLVFVAPERRLPSLWSELASRCRDEEIELEVVTDRPDLRAANASNSRSLAAISWNALLAGLRNATARAEDRAAAADIDQLAGLCAAFETDGFVPLSREDIDDLDVPRGVLRLTDLIQPIVEAAEHARVITVGSLRMGHHWGRLGRYVRFGDFAGGWIGVDFGLWASEGTTPIWLVFDA